MRAGGRRPARLPGRPRSPVRRARPRATRRTVTATARAPGAARGACLWRVFFLCSAQLWHAHAHAFACCGARLGPVVPLPRVTQGIMPGVSALPAQCWRRALRGGPWHANTPLIFRSCFFPVCTFEHDRPSAAASHVYLQRGRDLYMRAKPRASLCDGSGCDALSDPAFHKHTSLIFSWWRK